MKSASRQAPIRKARPSWRQRLAGLLRALAAIAGTAVVAAVAWGGVLLFEKLDRPIAVIGVDGEIGRVTASEIKDIVAANLSGGFLSLDLEQICEGLEKHPWIESASARRQWPDKVVIRIDEETPIARWGDTAFLNNRGQTLDMARAGDLDNLPLLAGAEGDARKIMRHYREIAQMLQPTGLKISEFRQAPRGNWELHFEQGPALIVGRDNLAGKLRRFLLVWERELKARAADIASVDIRYGNGVAVRWRKDENA
jgi:cell division protein FtsQ